MKSIRSILNKQKEMQWLYVLQLLLESRLSTHRAYIKQPRTIQKIMENQFHIIEMLENLEKKSSSYKQADGSVVDMSNVENALRDLVYEQPVFLFKATDSH